MTTPTGSLAPDTLVHGRYRVIRQIGRGGMGAVYEAVDGRLGNTVALKQTLVGGQALDAAFEREARVLAALRHPALPVVSDYFADEAGQFLVMQFIPGEDLGALLQRRAGPFAWAEVRPWAEQLLDALDYLHTQQPPIVHRDIKPQNLKLTPRGEIILLDFGLAKRSAADPSGAPASLFGYTPHYAPLEQIRGGGTDARSDLYSLAATLYALLTNSAPPGALDRAAAVFQGQPDPLRPAGALAPGLQPEVAELLARCLAVQPDDRPASAAAVRDALAQQVRVGPSSAGQPTVAQLRPGPPPPPGPLPTPGQAPAAPRRGWLAPAILFGILAALLLAGVLATLALVNSFVADTGPSDGPPIAANTAVLPATMAPGPPTPDPREEDPPAAGGAGAPDVAATAEAMGTQVAAAGVAGLPDVGATIAAVQTEVGASVGGVGLPNPGAGAGGFAAAAPGLSFGEQGSGAGFLDDPRGVAVGPDGAIYVADYASGRVQRFAADGRFERGWVTADERPILSIAADRQGRIFVSQNSQISIYDGASGAPQGTIDSGGYGFEDMVVTAEGDLLGIVWASGDVVRLGADGQERGRIAAPLERADSDSSPQAIATDGLGTLYLLGEGGAAVFVFSPDGAFRDRFAVEDSWSFSDLAVDGQGRIYVGGFFGGVHVFDGSGRPLGDIGMEGVPADLSFDDSNRLYVVTNAPRVLTFEIGGAQ